MNRLTHIGDFENTIDSMIDAFFHTFDIVSILTKSWCLQEQRHCGQDHFQKPLLPGFPAKVHVNGGWHIE